MEPHPEPADPGRRLALQFLAVAAPLMIAVSLIGGSAAEWGFSVLVMAFPVALIAVAIGGRRQRFIWSALFGLLMVFESGAVAMLLLRGRVFDVPWFGGLPASAAIMLYGLWLGPLVLVGLVYALGFDRFELSDGDLDRLADLERPHEDRT